jgi:HD superfamily phosphodiesterase
MPAPGDHDAVWRASLPYMRARKNDVHVPMVYEYARTLLESHPQADREVVLLAALLHDNGWAVVDQDKVISEGFGGGDLAKAMASDIRVAHEKEGARVAREILESLGYDEELVARVVEIVDGHDTREEALSLEDALVKDSDALWRWSITGASISADWWGETLAQYVDRVAPMIDAWLRTDQARAIACAEFAQMQRVLRTDLLREAPAVDAVR